MDSLSASRLLDLSRGVGDDRARERRTTARPGADRTSQRAARGAAGVQVLFAFLLAVPFANGFPRLGELDRDIFFVAFIATALSTVLLIAPSSYHRLRWREHDKERMLVVSNALTIGGLALLAIAITCTVFVITDFLFHRAWTAAFTTIIAVAFIAL